MSSLPFSRSPFASPGRGSRSAALSRRVFTRPSFELPLEIRQVADHGCSLVSGPVAVDDEAHPPERWATPAFQPHRLHRRDRSTYAWFGSVGLLLTLASVAGACAALALK